jgi:hypothetical protein
MNWRVWNVTLTGALELLGPNGAWQTIPESKVLEALHAAGLLPALEPAAAQADGGAA